MIVVSVLFILSVTSWIVVYFIKNAEQRHKLKHPLTVQKWANWIGSIDDLYLVDDAIYLKDGRRMNCKRCTKHSWELWSVNLCRCKRCQNIAKLEGELQMTSDMHSMSEIKSVVDSWNM